MSCHLPHDTEISLRAETRFPHLCIPLMPYLHTGGSQWGLDLEELKAPNCPTDSFLGSLEMALNSVL